MKVPIAIFPPESRRVFAGATARNLSQIWRCMTLGGTDLKNPTASAPWQETPPCHGTGSGNDYCLFFRS